MTGHLKLTCFKCTEHRTWAAEKVETCIRAAIEDGWVKVGIDCYVCPTCPVSVDHEGGLISERATGVLVRQTRGVPLA